jgi:hypothetical protein
MIQKETIRSFFCLSLDTTVSAPVVVLWAGNPVNFDDVLVHGASVAGRGQPGRTQLWRILGKYSGLAPSNRVKNPLGL